MLLLLSFAWFCLALLSEKTICFSEKPFGFSRSYTPFFYVHSAPCCSAYQVINRNMEIIRKRCQGFQSRLAFSPLILVMGAKAIHQAQQDMTKIARQVTNLPGEK